MLPNLKASRLYAHRANLERYRNILATHLTTIERGFVERRIEEEEAEIARLGGHRLDRCNGPRSDQMEQTLSPAAVTPDGDDPLTELRFLCPHTNRHLGTGVITTHIARMKAQHIILRLHCSHCGMEHDFKIEDALRSPPSTTWAQPIRGETRKRGLA